MFPFLCQNSIGCCFIVHVLKRNQKGNAFCPLHNQAALLSLLIDFLCISDTSLSAEIRIRTVPIPGTLPRSEPFRSRVHCRDPNRSDPGYTAEIRTVPIPAHCRDPNRSDPAYTAEIRTVLSSAACGDPN
ncbi:hypothetical protein Aduo_010613 [Ancylostoma duodenale]